jgi:hypothetical protein
VANCTLCRESLAQGAAYPKVLLRAKNATPGHHAVTERTYLGKKRKTANVYPGMQIPLELFASSRFWTRPIVTFIRRLQPRPGTLATGGALFEAYRE